jgi:Putative amidoligase enzyme
MKVKLERALKFGVEIEVKTSLSGVELAQKLRDAGINAIFKTGLIEETHRVTKAWKVVRDGSISNGWEVVSPPTCNIMEVKTVIETLKLAGCKADSACGIHVHHWCGDFNINNVKKLYNNYHAYQNEINEMLKVGRHNNQYAKPLTSLINRVNAIDTMEEFRNRIGGEHDSAYYNSCRYYVLNFRSFLRYETIEFRQYHGTMDAEEVLNWVLLTHRMVEQAQFLQDKNNGLVQDLKVENTHIEKYIKKQKRKFANRTA